MGSWCNEARGARTGGGGVSLMEAGHTTLGAPSARPPITRYKMNSSDPCATPEPHEPKTKRTEVTISTERRPNLSARVPAMNAPTAQPRRIDATLNPEPRLEE